VSCVRHKPGSSLEFEFYVKKQILDSCWSYSRIQMIDTALRRGHFAQMCVTLTATNQIAKTTITLTLNPKESDCVLRRIVYGHSAAKRSRETPAETTCLQSLTIGFVLRKAGRRVFLSCKNRDLRRANLKGD
jgi:hypothetical protein